VCLDVYPTLSHSVWLEQDLAAIGTERPVVLFHHYGVDSLSLPWWPDAEMELAAYANAIEDYNVVGIFHGHLHSNLHYQWENRDVYSPGTWRGPFIVVRMTDSTMSVGAYAWERTEEGHWTGGGQWLWSHHKSIVGSVTACKDDVLAPLVVSSYPNPFNAQTSIQFALPAAVRVNLSVFDVTGRRVRTLISGRELGARTHRVMWNGVDDRGTPLSSGTYFYRLRSDIGRAKGKMILVK
jgi:hypothetical protein